LIESNAHQASRQQSLIEAFEGSAITLKIIQVKIQFYFSLTGKLHELRRGYCSQLRRSAQRDCPLAEW
jgi:hypothetical protein